MKIFWCSFFQASSQLKFFTKVWYDVVLSSLWGQAFAHASPIILWFDASLISVQVRFLKQVCSMGYTAQPEIRIFLINHNDKNNVGIFIMKL